ncbi:hypothetical protein FEO91_16810 [Stenotrophomonas maltophilia]|nr:hypothetical protein FEO91_16810 [Stenotrophomonas maltophilia]
MLFDFNSKYSISMEIHPRMAWIYRVDQSRHLPTAAGICQRWGGVGVRGVSRMDAAAKPPGTGLRRPRTPTPPRHPTEYRFCCCCCCCLNAAAGAGLQALLDQPLTP